MRSLQKWGGFASLYMALAYIIGIVLFIFILDYPHISEPAQKMALVVNRQWVIYSTNLIMYILFGFALIIFTWAIYEKLKSYAPAAMRIASVTGFIWACLLIASGMISNAGMDPAIALFKENPAQATIFWSQIESVANGLSCADGEIIGGILTLMISIVAFRARVFPRALGYLGMVVGSIGIVSTIPGLKDLTGLFGITQVFWFIWLGGILLRREVIAKV